MIPVFPGIPVMIFRDSPDDAINVQMFAHHVWIDHNELSDCYDGLIDIKRGADYVTVSWNHTHHHTKTMLLGHSDTNGAQDIGRLAGLVAGRQRTVICETEVHAEKRQP